jgi:hypothetical protein
MIGHTRKVVFSKTGIRVHNSQHFVLVESGSRSSVHFTGGPRNVGGFTTDFSGATDRVEGVSDVKEGGGVEFDESVSFFDGASFRFFHSEADLYFLGRGDDDDDDESRSCGLI